MPAEITKTLTYLGLHLCIGFGVAYLLTGSVEVAGGIALIEPCVNAVAFFFHERLWKGVCLHDSAPAPARAMASAR